MESFQDVELALAAQRICEVVSNPALRKELICFHLVNRQFPYEDKGSLLARLVLSPEARALLEGVFGEK